MEERQRGDDAGQVLPLVAVILVVAACSVIAIGAVAVDVRQRARAATAADAAALAGVVDGAGAAQRLALDNGGALENYERLSGGDVRVRVGVGTARATARARARAGEGSAPAGGLAPAMRAALARAQQLLGRPVPITSGYRSVAEQRRLWNGRASNPYPVARPGGSKHQQGLAVDVPTAFVPFLEEVAHDAGLCRPFPVADPVHFELCGDGFTIRDGG